MTPPENSIEDSNAGSASSCRSRVEPEQRLGTQETPVCVHQQLKFPVGTPAGEPDSSASDVPAILCRWSLRGLLTAKVLPTHGHDRTGRDVKRSITPTAGSPGRAPRRASSVIR